MKIKIFLFHRVSPVRDFLWNPMEPELFEKIIIHLNKNYELVPLEQTLLGNYQPLGKKPLCAITFDDGYKDFLNYAFPVLQKYKAPSSMYVVTDCVDDDLPPWTYIINHLFINTSKLSIDLNLPDYPPSLHDRKWKTKEERISYAKKLSPFLKKIDYDEKKSIYQRIREEFNDVELPKGLMMSWNDIKEVHLNGCEIGSHSCSHPLLANKTNVDEIRKELTESGKKIESNINKFPLTISYPFGSYNETVKTIAQNAGYKIGVAVHPSTFDSSKHNLFEVPRIELYDEPFFKSRLRISGIIENINRMIKLLFVSISIHFFELFTIANEIN
jgi:peptidoglycan/xylan/chitin deacetylase (PgdA/CDA1 family)